jgi:hypothetical protein
MPIALPKEEYLAPQIFSSFMIENNDLIVRVEEPFGIIEMDLSFAVHLDPKTGLASTDSDDILFSIADDSEGNEHEVDPDWVMGWINRTLNPYLREKFTV